MGLGKKGEEIISEEVISVLIIVAFLAIMSGFLWSFSSNSQVLEEAYSKQIALLIDRAEPGSVFLIDMREPGEIFVKNIFDSDNVESYFGNEELERMVFIDNEKNSVIVSLKDGSGYEYEFFKDYEVDSNFREDGYLFVQIKRSSLENA